jgi:uncharacterized protein (DUF427 family)
VQKSNIRIRIRHAPSGTILAEGAKGWNIMPFEGNFYIRKRCLLTDSFRLNFIPGICPYKGLYFWMDLRLRGQVAEKSIAWFYWLPNPLLPFIWFRVALPGQHPDLEIEEFAWTADEKGPQ